MLGYLLLTILGLALSKYAGIGFNTFAFIGATSALSTFFYLIYLRRNKRISALLIFIDRHAIKLLLAWMAIYLTWCWLVLFANPYRYEANHGDAVFYVQTLWNLVGGLNPESSFFTMNGHSSPGDDPRYANTYGYVSIFSLHQYWLPIAVLTPLYAMFPQPPMHLFSLQIAVIVFGLPGVYWAVRQAGAARNFSVLAAIAYSLLPQIETQLFFKGYFDVLALGVMPWLFGALIGKKWRLMYFFAILVSLISYPHTYFVSIVGLSAILFLREIVPGAIIIAIGLLAMKLDSTIFSAAVSPHLAPSVTVPSFIQTYVLDRTIGSLGYNARVNLAYVITLLQGLAFIPVLAVRRSNQWDMTILGLLFVLTGAFILNLFRSAGWEFPRNSFFIAPLFFMAVVACLSLNREIRDIEQPSFAMLRDAPNALLFFSLASMIFVGGATFNYPPLASHFPWGSSSQILESEDTRSWNVAMAKLSAIVPSDASIAWRAGPEVQAYLTNRQHSWYMGREPDGVRYYVFLGTALNVAEEREWKGLIFSLRQRQDMKVMYDSQEGKRLIVFENLYEHPIPRNEDLVGWSILRDALLRKLGFAFVVEK